MVQYLMNCMTHCSFDNVIYNLRLIFYNFRNETRFSFESGETYQTDQMCEDNFQRDSQGNGFEHACPDRTEKSDFWSGP